MEKKIIISQFDEIEKKIDRLIEVCNRLETENAGLKEDKSRLERMLQEMKEEESKNNEVKALIRSKIDSLMDRLDNISEPNDNVVNLGQ